MFSHQIDQSKPTVGKQSRSKKCISSLVLIGIISASLSCTSSSASSTSTAASNRTVQPTATSSQGPITVVGPTPVAQVAEPHWRGNPNAKVVIEEWTDLQ